MNTDTNVELLIKGAKPGSDVRVRMVGTPYEEPLSRKLHKDLVRQLDVALTALRKAKRNET